MTHVWQQLWPRIGLDGWGAVAVVLSTILSYGLLVLLIRLLGQRTLARLTGFDVAATVALGAIVGRVTLGHTPTLAAGVLAVTTLLGMEAVFGEARRFTGFSRLIDNRATLLVVDGALQPDLMRRAHVVEDEVRSVLRKHSVLRLAEVALLVLERTGDMSVIRTGQRIEPALIAGVRGADRIPAHLLATNAE